MHAWRAGGRAAATQQVRRPLPRRPVRPPGSADLPASGLPLKGMHPAARHALDDCVLPPGCARPEPPPPFPKSASNAAAKVGCVRPPGQLLANQPGRPLRTPLLTSPGALHRAAAAGHGGVAFPCRAHLQPDTFGAAQDRGAGGPGRPPPGCPRPHLCGGQAGHTGQGAALPRWGGGPPHAAAQQHAVWQLGSWGRSGVGLREAHQGWTAPWVPWAVCCPVGGG